MLFKPERKCGVELKTRSKCEMQYRTQVKCSVIPWHRDLKNSTFFLQTNILYFKGQFSEMVFSLVETQKVI